MAGFLGVPEDPELHQPSHGGAVLRKQAQNSQATTCLGRRWIVGWSSEQEFLPQNEVTLLVSC